MVSKFGALFAGAVLLAALVSVTGGKQLSQHCLSAYATGLGGRTPNQQYNARRAALQVDGSVVEPGQTFSFNNAVGQWSSRQGYLLAPVSYNGTLVDDFGGGVCQTSTTVYNAALLAGMQIVERHSHTFAPGYVSAGRDAAVAYENVDLRFRNPYSFPVVLHARVINSYMICGITAMQNPPYHITVDTRVLDTFRAPTAPPQPGEGLRKSRWQIRGRPGVRVLTIRRCYDSSGNLVRTDQISDNTYRPIAAELCTTQ